MKKVFVLIISFILMLSGVACAEKTVRFDEGEVAKITVFLGSSGRVVDIEEREEIQALTEDIGGLTFRKEKSSGGYDGFRYSMKWYDEEGKLLEELAVMSEARVKYQGYFYEVKEGAIDLDLIEGLLNPYYQKPTDSDLTFWITEDVVSVDFSSYRTKSYLLGAVEYIPASYEEGESEYVGYLVSAYPDYADGGKFVTRICVSDTKVKVLGGLTIAATVEEWDAALTKLRFERQEVTETLDEGTEYKELWESGDGKLTVTLKKGADGYAMYIQATVTNREGIGLK